MRCPDCGKFVAFGDLATDEIEVAIDEDSGAVSITGRLVLPCGECGTELKALDVDETHEAAESFPDAPDGWELSYELDGDPEIEPEDRVQTTDRHGKPIKSARYMKTYRGARVSGSVIRRAAPPDDGLGLEGKEESASFDVLVEEQASAFEECC